MTHFGCIFCHTRDFFRSSKGGHGPSGPMVNTPLIIVHIKSGPNLIIKLQSPQVMFKLFHGLITGRVKVRAPFVSCLNIQFIYRVYLHRLSLVGVRLNGIVLYCYLFCLFRKINMTTMLMSKRNFNKLQHVSNVLYDVISIIIIINNNITSTEAIRCRKLIVFSGQSVDFRQLDYSQIRRTNFGRILWRCWAWGYSYSFLDSGSLSKILYH